MSICSITSASVELAGRGCARRVEVDADEVDELDLVLGGRAQVLGVVADGKDARVELRVERLDAPVMISGKPVKSSIERTSRPAPTSSRAVSAGRDQLDARSASPRANSTMPRLSDTDSSARRTRTSPGANAAASCAPTFAGSPRALTWRA